MSGVTVKRFPSPFDVDAPAGAEGWQELYPYFLTFRENRRAADDGRFWFCDSMHWPNVFKPFETILVEFAVKSLGAYNTRTWLIPGANGVDYRVHNGYIYMSPVAVAPEHIAERIPHFLERAGFYFQNWTALEANWHRKTLALIAEMEALTFEPLPAMVDRSRVFEGQGLDDTFELLAGYDRLIQLLHKAWQFHFECLNLGYAAYLDFFQFCKEVFPSIPEQVISRMVQGIEVDLFRPDDELKRLAKLAVALGVAGLLKKGTAAEAFAAVLGHANGGEWLAQWEQAKHPWFNYSSGNGYYASDKVWLDYPDVPLGFLRNYIANVEGGVEIDRPVRAVAAERDRITAEYEALMPSDEAREAFRGKLTLARTVFPYVENHNFYIEHWALSVFWRKMRALSRILVGAGFWREEDDMFYLRREEIVPALFDYCNGWAVGTEPIGPSYWPARIASRKKIVAALASRRPPPAFNEPPEVIAEPFTIMLWGITSERVQQWVSADGHDGGTLRGMAASPGHAEGIARVVSHFDELQDIVEGEILVASVTAPSWAPVFSRIKAIVTDIGGLMSHAAIVCREYGVPAVTGTGSASTTIRTGQRIRVDGSTGEVTIVS